jgi:hypothetical protein
LNNQSGIVGNEQLNERIAGTYTGVSGAIVAGRCGVRAASLKQSKTPAKSAAGMQICVRRHCERSEAIHSFFTRPDGLLRFARNDDLNAINGIRVSLPLLVRGAARVSFVHTRWQMARS